MAVCAVYNGDLTCSLAQWTMCAAASWQYVRSTHTEVYYRDLTVWHSGQCVRQGREELQQQAPGLLIDSATQPHLVVAGSPSNPWPVLKLLLKYLLYEI